MNLIIDHLLIIRILEYEIFMVNIFGYDYQEESLSLNKNKIFFYYFGFTNKNGTGNILYMLILIKYF
jgi:hypothetical protein